MYGRIPLGRKNRLRQIDSLQSLNLPAEYTFPPSEQAESLSSVIHTLKLNSLEDLYKIEMMILYILTLKNLLTNFKKNGTIEKSSIGGRLFIQAPGKLTDQRDGPKTKGMVTILPWARTN